MRNRFKQFRLDNLQKKMGYTFRNMELLDRAFRHASYVNEMGQSDLEDNERLEFLGDAVLDLAISHILMDRFPDVDEGALSRYRSMVVNESGLCAVASSLKLGGHIMLGKGEEQTEGRKKPSILANTMEALLGAVYLDAGFDESFHVIKRLFSSSLKRVGSQEMVHDFKSRLQEFTQKISKTVPKYRLVHEKGPPHDKRFFVEISYEGKTLAQGDGRSKKEAEQRAAREALLCLKSD